MVSVVSRLIDGVKAKGSRAPIDISDIAQRESFDVIGMVPPSITLGSDAPCAAIFAHIVFQIASLRSLLDNLTVPTVEPCLHQRVPDKLYMCCAQVGFGKDFQASRNIDNDVGRNFRLLGSFLRESVKRSGSPLRQFSRSQVQPCKLSCQPCSNA